MQEDVVAIEMLPESEWSCPSSMILEDVEEKADDETEQEVWLMLSSCTLIMVDTVHQQLF